MLEKSLSLLQHINELRKRLLWIIAVLLLTAIAGLFAAEPIIQYLKRVPPASTIVWNAFSPWDSIQVYMNITVLLAALITLPFALYQIWSFVRPALRKQDQSLAWRYIPFVCMMLLVGVSFSYFVVFPMAFTFTNRMTEHLHLIATFGISQYFHFMFSLMIPISLAFQLPVVVMFLTKLRIINPQRLSKFRKYAYFILVIIATMISPPEFVSHLMVSVPLIILYEFSVAVSRMVYHKQLATDKLIDEEQLITTQQQ